MVGIAFAGVIGAVLPQAGTATAAELARLHESGPFVLALVQTFALDHIFRSVWFLVLTGLLSGSLLIIVVEQVQRLWAQWSLRLSPAHFQSAPFVAEFERPVVSSTRETITRLHIWSEKRLGLAGSAVFHLGLLLVITAGAWRALFGADAVVDLMEGETLAPQASAWAAQWPGVWGKPVCLDQPIILKTVKARRYEDGDLRELKVILDMPGGGRTQSVEVAVNQDLHLSGERLFLAADFGPAALLEWRNQGHDPIFQSVLLTEQGNSGFVASVAGPNGLCAHLRGQMDDAGHPSSVLEVRVMRDQALLYLGDARVGQTCVLADGVKLVLHGTPLWARLRGSHDAALWLAYAGFVLVMAGAAMIFMIIKVDGCVMITPVGERERVFIALKPQRFAPLFRERFEQLVRENGGSLPQPAIAHPQLESPVPCSRRGKETEHSAIRNPQSAISGLLASTATKVGEKCGLAGWLLLALCLFGQTGCQNHDLAEARQLVERYNQVVSEAYRRGDIKLVDPVVGPNEGKKLTGLIGVRLDLGITLDSRLLALEVIEVSKAKDELRVRTKERWHYRDLKIGSGQQVGEASLDNYEMLYIFKKIDKAWMVDEIKFTTPPQVSRKQTPWIADRAALHGMAGPTNAKEGAKP